MIRVVTFDFWNTLVVASDDVLYRRRAEHWVGVLGEAGHEVTVDEMGEAFAASWQTFQDAWRANRQYLTADGVARVLELLELPAEGELHERLVEHYEAGVVESGLSPAPNLLPALEALKAAGVRIGIICDVGMTPSTALRKVLEGFGVLHHFDHFSFSDEVGVYKPAPAIFEHALAGLGGVASEAAHVGDLRRTDVAGANRAGWTSVRYSGLFDDPGRQEEGTLEVEADHVVADHAELAGALGLG